MKLAWPWLAIAQSVDFDDQVPSNMAYYDEDDVFPVTRITAGTVSAYGRRVFILQAHINGHPLTWVIEKEQAIGLSRGLPDLLTEIQSEFPELADPMVAAQPNLTLSEPLEAEFRVASIQIGYDRFHDLVVLTLIDRSDFEDFDATEEDLEARGYRVYATRGQALLLSRQAEEVVVAGRPPCPRCGEPMDDFGHFCLPPEAQLRRAGIYLH